MDFLENIKDEIKIPKGIDLAIQKGMERGREEKKAQRKVKRYKRVAAAAAILIGVITFGVANPKIVKAIPIVQSIFKIIGHGNMGVSLEKFEQFSTSVNKTVDKSGIKITVDEIVIDDNILAITFTEEGKNLIENREYMGSIKLNGKLVRSRSSKDKRIDDNKLVTVTYANVADMDLTKDINVDINIVWFGDVKGPWDFKFNVSKADSAVNSKTVILNKSIKIPNSILKVDKLISTPLGNTLMYSGVYDEGNNNTSNGIYDFLVLDEKGRALEISPGGVSSNKEKYSGKIEILNSLNKVKSITLVPIFKQWGTKNKVINEIHYPILQTSTINNDPNLPREIITKSRPVTEKEKSSGYSLDSVIHIYNIDKAREFSTIDNLINKSIKVGNNNTVTIKNIELTDKETKITFKIDGNGAYTYRNIYSVVILDDNYNDVERGEGGDSAVLENADEGIVSIKLPPIDKSKKYKIALPTIDEPQIEEQYKINIELNK